MSWRSLSLHPTVQYSLLHRCKYNTSIIDTDTYISVWKAGRSFDGDIQGSGYNMRHVSKVVSPGEVKVYAFALRCT